MVNTGAMTISPPWPEYAKRVLPTLPELRISAVLAVISGVLGGMTPVMVGLARSDYLIYGMSGMSLLVATMTALYVYLKVAKADRNRRRIEGVEATAADIERHRLT